MSAPTIHFFTDQNVAESVGEAILARGHHLTRLREVMLNTTKDPIIGIACSKAGQVLVSHDRDFRDVKKRINAPGREAVTRVQFNSKLHKIHLECCEYEAANRLVEAFSLVEAEWELITEERPMIITLRANSISTRR